MILKIKNTLDYYDNFGVGIDEQIRRVLIGGYYLQIYRFEVLLPFGLRRFIFSIYPFRTSSSIARFTVDTLHLFSRAMVLWDW